MTFRALGPETLLWYLGQLGLAYALNEKPRDARAAMDELEELSYEIEGMLKSDSARRDSDR